MRALRFCGICCNQCIKKGGERQDREVCSSAASGKTKAKRGSRNMVVLKNKAFRSIVLAVLMAAGLLVAGLLASVEPAQATFPGDNGRIAFASHRGAPTTQIYSVA